MRENREGTVRARRLSALSVSLVLVIGRMLGAVGDAHASERSGPITGDLPPVILIVVDTLRADHLSQYGFPLETSPGLDRFASQATLFTRCYANAPWTRPSMTTLFTGVHPINHRVTRRTALAEGTSTLARRLQAAGLRTLGISLNANVSASTGLDQGFDVLEEMLGASSREYKDVREMLRLVFAWRRGAGPDPYFLFLLPMNVHGPYKIPEARRSDLLGHPPQAGFRYYGDVMTDILKGDEGGSARARFTPEMLTSLQEQYATAVRYTTDEIGRFLEYLRHVGDYDRALIIVTADHGEELFEHGGFSHGFTLFNEVLHVPLLVKRPYQRQAGRVDERVTLMDVFPTTMELLGLAIPASVDGTSFAALLDPRSGARGPRGVPPSIFSSIWNERCVGNAILDPPWKLIRIEKDHAGRENATLLFDLGQDPGELRNLAHSRPEVARRLELALSDRMAELDDANAREYARHQELDQKVEEQLAALGYLH